MSTKSHCPTLNQLVLRRTNKKNVYTNMVYRLDFLIQYKHIQFSSTFFDLQNIKNLTLYEYTKARSTCRAIPGDTNEYNQHT